MDGILCAAQLFRAASGNAAYTIALQASVKCGTAEMGDRLFQDKKAIIDREEHAFAEDDDQRLLRRSEHTRYRLFWPLPRVLGRAPASPFGDRLGIDPQSRGKSSVGFLALLNLAAHCRVVRALG